MEAAWTGAAGVVGVAKGTYLTAPDFNPRPVPRCGALHTYVNMNSVFLSVPPASPEYIVYQCKS